MTSIRPIPSRFRYFVAVCIATTFGFPVASPAPSDEKSTHQLIEHTDSALALSATAASPPLPLGWRALTPAELGDDWRRDAPGRYAAVHGDFDGNGQPDLARLLVSVPGQQPALFIFLQQPDHTFRSRRVTGDSGQSVEIMGIRKVAPGTYRTACGKGYWACDKAEPPKITIAHDAVELFKFESFSSYHFWDDRHKVFKGIAIAD